MGYFSNGTEGHIYEERYCVRCIHYDGGEGAKPCCPVWAAHLLYCYNADEKTQSVLDLLIPQNGVVNAECAMFVENPTPPEPKGLPRWIIRDENGNEVEITESTPEAEEKLKGLIEEWQREIDAAASQ